MIPYLTILFVVILIVLLYFIDRQRENFWNGPSLTPRRKYVNKNLFDVPQTPNVTPITTSITGLENSVTSSTGLDDPPIIFDREIFAPKNSRLRGSGDPIRGDLPIEPAQGPWFVPQGAFEGPSQVLQQGALNVIGGIDNQSGKNLANLIYKYSGGTKTTLGGVDLSMYVNKQNFDTMSQNQTTRQPRILGYV